jgi:hypothetical protein
VLTAACACIPVAFRFTSEELVRHLLAPPSEQVVAALLDRGREDAAAWVKNQGL